jgi:phage tail sheath protein FI
VCAPGQTDPVIQDAVLSHCENMRYRFAILDSPESLTGGVDKLPKPRDSKYGALLLPVDGGVRPGQGQHLPAAVGPHGRRVRPHRRERGVHKAPANEIVRGALGLKYNITRGEQDLLNPKGINCIRFPNRGIRVWGARTISSDPRGATSTSAACSTWSSSPSRTAPSGWCSSPTTRSCGSA